MEKTIVRENLMTEKNYTPYCGSDYCMSRTRFNGTQFNCIYVGCSFETEFPKIFIDRYVKKWNLTH